MRSEAISLGRKTFYPKEVTSSQIDLETQCNSDQNLQRLFWGNYQTHSKIMCTEELRTKVNTTQKKKSKLKQLYLPHIKLYYKATIKTVKHWYQESRKTPTQII